MKEKFSIGDIVLVNFFPIPDCYGNIDNTFNGRQVACSSAKYMFGNMYEITNTDASSFGWYSLGKEPGRIHESILKLVKAIT